MTTTMPEFVEAVVGSPHDLQLDGTKIGWYKDRVLAWQRGEKIAPITMDVAWTRKCQSACNFCVFPDTVVLMADGSQKRMIDIKVGEDIASVDKNGLQATSKVTAHWQTSPWTRGLQIEMQFGKLKCTADHLVLTDSGWVAAGDLRVGDYVWTAQTDGGREASQTRDEFGLLGESGWNDIAGEAASASHRIQQNKNFGTALSDGSEEGFRKAYALKQDAAPFRRGAGWDGYPHEGEQASSRASNRCREGDASSTHAGERPWKSKQTDAGTTCCSQRTNEAEQSHEKSHRGSQDARNDGQKSWVGFLVSAIQETVGRGSTSWASTFRQGQGAIQFAYEGSQSYEGCGYSRENARVNYARAANGGFRSNEANMGGREDYSGHVFGEGERQGSKSNGTQTVSYTAVLSRSIRWGWDILVGKNNEWDQPQSGFHFWKWEKQDSASGSRSLLASGSRDGSYRDGGLHRGGVESIRALDEASFGLDDACCEAGDKIVVGRNRVISISDAGSSPVYDLECQPNHNFVADGIVVHNCYASLQSSDGGGEITKKHAFEFLEDAAEIGVKGISLISDGESTNVPYYAESIKYGASLGIQIGISSNGVLLTRDVLEEILPSLTYLRFNFSGGERKRYAEIMGMKQVWFDKIQDHIRAAMEIKKRDNLSTNINMQFVVAPREADQIIPFAKLAKQMGNSVPGNGGFYGIMKHCADSADNALGVDYRQYSDLFPLFEEAEAMSDENCRIVVKWSRIQDEGKRHYTRCMGPPFILQMSGSGLIAPCGQKFNNKYAKFHIGHIQQQRFRDIFRSDRYWDVLGYLSGGTFRPDLECGENCLQQNSNQWLSDYVDGKVDFPTTPAPPHLGFL